MVEKKENVQQRGIHCMQVSKTVSTSYNSHSPCSFRKITGINLGKWRIWISVFYRWQIFIENENNFVNDKVDVIDSIYNLTFVLWLHRTARSMIIIKTKNYKNAKHSYCIIKLRLSQPVKNSQIYKIKLGKFVCYHLKKCFLWGGSEGGLYL